MKKYMFCFLLFAATSLLCLGIGFVITKDSVQPEEAIPGATLETETVTEDQIVINQEKVSPAPEKEKEKFYLVSEDGYLLVLYQGIEKFCLLPGLEGVGGSHIVIVSDVQACIQGFLIVGLEVGIHIFQSHTGP
mgnify:CR=1 FL=1